MANDFYRFGMEVDIWRAVQDKPLAPLDWGTLKTLHDFTGGDFSHG